jgi:hypothetical protein
MKTQTLIPRATCQNTMANRWGTACSTTLLTLLLLTLPAMLEAQFSYTTNNGTITIFGETWLPGGAVTIPSTINGLSVTSIGGGAFEDWFSLTSVTIPDSVTNIADFAFDGCTGLSSVTIGSGLVSIGDWAFASCSSLTTVPIPDSVTRIGGEAFYECRSLASVVIPNSVTNIGEAVFEWCVSLTNVTIPNSVTSIGDGAFEECFGLTSVVIPSSVTNIGLVAFLDCTNLTGAYFKGNAPSIGSNVFEGDPNATVYYLPGTKGWGTTFGGLPTALWNQTPSSITGNILNSSGEPIAGACVHIGTELTTSAPDGSYALTGFSAGRYPVVVSATGYTASFSTLVVPALGSLVQNFTLTPAAASPSGALPTVTSITTQYSPNGEALYFLDGVSFPVTFTANVDWGTNSPGSIRFITPKSGVYQVNASSGNPASQQIDVGSAFGSGGQLQVQAVSADGASSIATVANFVVMSALPLQHFGLFVPVDAGNHFSYQSVTATNIQFLADSLAGDDGVEVDQSIPLFGGNPIELGFSPTLSASITANHLDLLQVEVSATSTSEEDQDNDEDDDPGLDLGGLHFDMGWPEIDIFANYSAGLQQWQWGGSLGVDGDVGASATTYLPVPIPVPVFASVDLELPFGATLALESINPITWNGTLALDPAVTGTLGAGVDGLLAVEGWVTGGVDLTFQYPQRPHLEYYQIQLSAGVIVYALLWSYTDQLFTWTWPGDNVRRALLSLRVLNTRRLPQPYPRNYINRPLYASFHHRPKPTGVSTSGAMPLDLTPSLYALQTDVLPYSESSVSAAGTNCYAVWLYDNPGRSVNNRTMLVFSTFDGTSWSTFAPVADDGTADFHPQLRAFSDGSAVVAWENEAAVLPTNAGFTAMITNLGIATAFYDPAARRWQPMQQLTTNRYLRRSPRVAGVAENNLMLVWVANPNNDLEGGAAATNELWFSTWNGIAWSTPQMFASVPYPLLKYDMVYDGTNAYVVMSLDADNTLTNVNAHELFEMAYQNGSWGGLQQLTSDPVPNDNPQMAIDPNGHVVLTWLKGGEVSGVADFNLGNRQVVVTNRYSSNLGDFKLASGSDGRLAILWAQPSRQYPSDLYVTFYDPIFKVWGSPKQLTVDPETEMETAAAFFGTNELVALYDRLSIAVGGTNQVGSVITNADLYVLQYQLTNDLALLANSLTASPGNPAPGNAAILSVTAENLGDSGVSNVLVAFYEGNPSAGGTIIAQANLAIVLAPGATINVSIPWTVPATTSALPIYAVVGPNNQFSGTNLSSSEVSNTFVEPDLAVRSVTWGQITSNLLSVTATVANLGTIPSQPATVSFLLNSLTGSNLFSTNILSLAPGQSVGVNFLWSVSNLGNGLSLFAVVNAGANALDFNPQNNALELTIQPNITQVNVELGRILLLSGGAVQVGVTGLAGQTYPIQVSTDLVNWDFLANVTLTNLSGGFIDASGTNVSQRFYRAVVH